MSALKTIPQVIKIIRPVIRGVLRSPGRNNIVPFNRPNRFPSPDKIFRNPQTWNVRPVPGNPNGFPKVGNPGGSWWKWAKDATRVGKALDKLGDYLDDIDEFEKKYVPEPESFLPGGSFWKDPRRTPNRFPSKKRAKKPPEINKNPSVDIPKPPNLSPERWNNLLDKFQEAYPPGSEGFPDTVFTSSAFIQIKMSSSKLVTSQGTYNQNPNNEKSFSVTPGTRLYTRGISFSGSEGSLNWAYGAEVQLMLNDLVVGVYFRSSFAMTWDTGPGYWTGSQINSYTITITSPAAPDPYKNEEPRTEEMSCPQCQARTALRELQQTITVEATTITKLPTGDLLATTTQMPQRVFALPGTQASIREQFNIISEIKKRTAHAFNQARRSKMLAKIVQIMNITDVFLNVHNAMMLSADIGETFFDAIFGTIDIVVKLVDDIPIVNSFFDAEEFAGFDSKELVGKAIDETAKKVFGVQTWEAAKAKYAAFNTMVRSANTVLLNMKDLRDTQGDLAQMAAERIGVVNNALVRAGVLDENGDLMSEKVNRRAAFLDKLEKIEDSGVVNTAQFFQGLAANALDVKETKKELEDSKKEFQETTKKAIEELTGKATASKDASQGANSTNDNAKPVE